MTHIAPIASPRLHRAQHSFAIATVLFAFGLSASSVKASDDSDLFGNDADATAPAAKKSYRKAIKDGVSEYEAHHFEEALSYFRRAHQIYPNARTFRGIGMASFELRDYVTAVRSLTAAVNDQRKPLSTEQRNETQDLIDRCRLFMAIYSVQISPSDAQVTIDANPLELGPDGKLMLGLGEHTVEARLKGYRTRVLKIQVRGGERKDLELTLDPLTGPAARSAPAAVAGTTSEPSAPLPLPPLMKSNALPWLVAGGAAAVIAVSAGVYLSMQIPELSSCRNPPDKTRCKDESSLVAQRNISAATTIVTGAAAVTFVTIGILQRRAEIERSRKYDVACAPGLFSVTCAGRF